MCNFAAVFEKQSDCEALRAVHVAKRSSSHEVSYTKLNTQSYTGMKKIEAIIRKTKFDEVKEALLAADINWFEYSDVHGIGQQRQERVYRGVQYSTDIIERVCITIICRDIFVEPTIQVLLREAHTGEVGDGRIFISDVLDCYSIRTGDHGDQVIAEKK